MTVREFDGIDDVIILDAGDTSTIDGGPVTVAAWVKPNSATQDLGLMAGYNTSQEVYSIFMAGSTGGVGALHGGTGNLSSTVDYIDGQWQLISYTKLDGDGNTVRWHVYNPNTATWIHNDSDVADDEALPVIENQLGQTFGSFYRGRLAVVAVWSSVLSDAAIEAAGLEFSLAGWLGASPAALWPLNQASTADPVEDLTSGAADQNSITGTTVVIGDDPPGFSFSLAPNEVSTEIPLSLDVIPVTDTDFVVPPGRPIQPDANTRPLQTFADERLLQTDADVRPIMPFFSS